MGGRVILHDSPAGGGVDGGVRRGFREKLLDAACTFMSIVRFATGPKRSMGHVPWAEKDNFLFRGRGSPTVYRRIWELASSSAGLPGAAIVLACVPA